MKGSYSIAKTLENASSYQLQFWELAQDVQHVRRGMDLSDLFFIRSVIAEERPSQIIESGRALGQSTLLLAKCFPDIPVISIEHDRDHPDASIALLRLKDCKNVTCLFGDARDLLPELVRPGDVVVIDGPKDFRALKLAYQVIRKKKPAFVFIHDCNHGKGIRSFLQKNVPHAFFSDDPEIVTRYCSLDHYKSREELKYWQKREDFPVGVSYAGAVACIPYQPRFPSFWQVCKLRVARLLDNLFRQRSAT